MEFKDILAQIFGIIAMFFSVFSFQMNKHKHIMIMQILATAFFGVQYFLLGAMTGVSMDIIGVARGFVFYHKDKKWAAWNGWIVIFMLMFAVFCGVTWAGSMGGIINEVFVEISSVVGLLRYDIKRKPKE